MNASNDSVTDDVTMTTVTEGNFSDDAPFLETNPSMAIPYLAAVSGALVIGVVGNLLIIGAVYVEKKLRHDGYQFIINLAVADLVITAIAEPMCILGVTHGRGWFRERPWLCEAIASLCLTACMCAFFSIAVLTFYRYCFILHRSVHEAVYSNKKATVMCLAVWSLAIGVEIGNYFGWGDHTFDDKSHQCIWDRRASLSFTLFFIVGLVVIPLVLMTTAYFVIFCNIFRSKKTILMFQAEHAADVTLQALQQALESCRMIFTLVVSYIVCWTPYVVVVLLDQRDKLPMWVHLWVTYLAHMHSSVSWIIYACTGQLYRRCFINIMTMAFCRDQDGTSAVNSVSETKKDNVSTVSTLPSAVNNILITQRT